MKNNKKQKKKFKLFDMNRDGKGVDINENTKPTFAFFFKLYFRKFSNLLRLNLLMLAQIVPIVAAVLVYFFAPQSPSVDNALFAPLYGISQSSASGGLLPFLDLSATQIGTPLMTPWVIAIIAVLLVALGITWGWQNVGAAYVLRGLVRGDAVFIFSDFFYGIKRNFKQGFFLGLIDFTACVLLVVDFLFFYSQAGQGFFYGVMYFATFALAIIYFMMRFYIYLILVTFDIKNIKILKNALIFSILGIKRNILALIGIVVFVLLHALALYILLIYGISFTVVIPFVYIVSTLAFMGAYAAYPIIDRYMIAPYADEKKEEEFIYFKEEAEDNEKVSEEASNGDTIQE